LACRESREGLPFEPVSDSIVPTKFHTPNKVQCRGTLIGREERPTVGSRIDHILEERMIQKRVDRQINFLVEIDKLKTVSRRAYLAADPGRRENSAEHSWHTGMMALVLSEYAQEPVDLARLIRMLLIHDIIEIDAGDTVMYDKQGASDKAERERRGAKRIFGLLPDNQRDELSRLWGEFENGITPEAKFARALDMLMPLLHNFHTQGKRWKEDGITFEQVSTLYQRTQEGCPRLREFALSLIDECVNLGYLPKPDA
jgi:putative hydrolase of HD superfamily